MLAGLHMILGLSSSSSSRQALTSKKCSAQSEWCAPTKVYLFTYLRQQIVFKVSFNFNFESQSPLVSFQQNGVEETWEN